MPKIRKRSAHANVVDCIYGLGGRICQDQKKHFPKSIREVLQLQIVNNNLANRI